jgi:hypothetical protein
MRGDDVVAATCALSLSSSVWWPPDSDIGGVAVPGPEVSCGAAGAGGAAAGAGVLNVGGADPPSPERLGYCAIRDALALPGCGA